MAVCENHHTFAAEIKMKGLTSQSSQVSMQWGYQGTNSLRQSTEKPDYGPVGTEGCTEDHIPHFFGQSGNLWPE